MSRCILTGFLFIDKKCLTPSSVRNSFQSVERAFNPVYQSKYDSSMRVHEIPKRIRKKIYIALLSSFLFKGTRDQE